MALIAQSFRSLHQPSVEKTSAAWCHLGLIAFAVLPGCASFELREPREPQVEGKAEQGEGALPLRASRHLALGLPEDEDPSDEVLLDRGEFVLSYSRTHNAPNWVAWRLEAADLGAVERGSSFRADLGLPAGLTPIEPDALRKSGWDRGHLCPSEDRTASAAANRQTFIMSNVLPQNPTLNRGSWARLEADTRAFAQEGQTVQVLAGALWQDGAASESRVGGMTIPSRLFKIVVASRGDGQPESINETDTVIAVIAANSDAAKGHSWREFQTSVDAIEEASGYDFLAELPDTIETALEARSGQ